MTPDDAAAFAEIMVRLDTVYQKPASPFRGAAYKEALADVPMDLLRVAVSRHIQNARTYPRPADLRVLADEELSKRERRALLPAPAALHEGERTYYCYHCLDMGWINWDGSDISMIAPVYYSPKSERPQGAAVRPCACAPHNPAFERRKRYARGDHSFRRPW